MVDLKKTGLPLSMVMWQVKREEMMSVARPKCKVVPARKGHVVPPRVRNAYIHLNRRPSKAPPRPSSSARLSIKQGGKNEENQNEDSAKEEGTNPDKDDKPPQEHQKVTVGTSSTSEAAHHDDDSWGSWNEGGKDGKTEEMAMKEGENQNEKEEKKEDSAKEETKENQTEEEWENQNEKEETGAENHLQENQAWEMEMAKEDWNWHIGQDSGDEWEEVEVESEQESLEDMNRTWNNNKWWWSSDMSRTRNKWRSSNMSRTRNKWWSSSGRKWKQRRNRKKVWSKGKKSRKT